MKARANCSDCAIQNLRSLHVAHLVQVAEHNNFSIRQRPEILGFVYQSRTLRDWIRDMATKPRGRDFIVQPGTMGNWISNNLSYLESAVGRSDL